MNYEIDVVHQNPLALAAAFHMKRPDTLFLEFFFHAVGDRLIVSGRSAGANEEVVGEGANPLKIEPDQILGFLVECCFNRFG